MSVAATAVEYADVSWTNLVHVRARFKADTKEEIDVLDELFSIPEKYMQKAKELVGDGLATITTGSELKTSDFGTGASCFVSVKLTCNQDEASIFAAGELAREIAVEQAHVGLQVAEARLITFISEQNKKEAPAPAEPVPASKPVTTATKGPLPRPRTTHAKKAAEGPAKKRVASASTSGNAPQVTRLGKSTGKPKHGKK